MASANFNTQIVSSAGPLFKQYDLDVVITKDFDGPYNYGYNPNEVPVGVTIIQDKNTGQWFLNIPPLVTFELSVFVTNSDKSIESVATTTVTVEEPNGIAIFNTKIVSSNSDNILEYNLDEVITKNFLSQGRYGYEIYSDYVPDGVEVIYNMNSSTILRIPPMVEFELSLIVDDGTKERLTFAIATTRVTIDTKPSFSNEITKFFESENYTQKKGDTAQNWSNIISNRISSGDLIDGPDRPKQ